MIERLRLRAELGAFEAALRQRMDRLAPFDDARFARVRAVERDATGAVSVLSTYVAGDRLCDLLDAATNLPAHEATSPSVDAALGFLLEALAALEAFHSATGVAHGAVATGRIALTSSGQVVLLDTLFGQALERLQVNRRRLWTEFGLALPAPAGASRFDHSADISQVSLAAMMIVLGRPFRANDYPDALPDLITEVIEIAQIRGSSRFASELHKFLHRTLPLPARRAHASAEEAAAEVRQVAREIGVQRCRTALVAFVGDMNRVIADARGQQQAPERGAAVEIPFEPTPEVTFEIDEPLFVQNAAEPAAPAEPIEDPVPEPLAQLGYEPAPAGETIENAPDFVEEPAAPALEETVAAPSYPEAEPILAVLSEPVPPVTERAPYVEIEVPAPVATIEPPKPVPVAHQAEPDPEPADSKRGRRNARRHRDKLRSNATPPPPPAAVAPPAAAPPPPAPPAPARPPLIPPMPAYAAVMPLPGVGPAAPPRKTAQPLRDEAPIAAPFVAPVAPIRVEPPAPRPQPFAPLAFKSEPSPFKADPVPFKSETLAFKSEPIAFKSEPLGFKNAPPAGFSPSQSRAERRETPHDPGAVLFMERGTSEPTRTIPWRFVAAALVVIAVAIGAGRKYLPSSEPAEAAPMPSSEVVAAAKVAAAAEKSGTVVLTTEPAGAGEEGHSRGGGQDRGARRRGVLRLDRGLFADSARYRGKRQADRVERAGTVDALPGPASADDDQHGIWLQGRSDGRYRCR